jgi:hypothetical protein
MQKVSGRSGSAARARAKYPGHVATIAPASHATSSRPAICRAMAQASSARPTPDIADQNRAASSVGPVTRYVAAVSQ